MGGELKSDQQTMYDSREIQSGAGVAYARELLVSRLCFDAQRTSSALDWKTSSISIGFSKTITSRQTISRCLRLDLTLNRDEFGEIDCNEHSAVLREPSSRSDCLETT